VGLEVELGDESVPTGIAFVTPNDGTTCTAGGTDLGNVSDPVGGDGPGCTGFSGDVGEAVRIVRFRSVLLRSAISLVHPSEPLVLHLVCEDDRERSVTDATVEDPLEPRFLVCRGVRSTGKVDRSVLVIRRDGVAPRSKSQSRYRSL
jgi:hypothetical protein